MIRDDIWPSLRERGCQAGSKATFHRRVGENWQVVNFQRSSFSDAEHVALSINLGVALARLRGGVLDWPEGKRPLEYQCHSWERLGSLLGDPSGGRWDVHPETDTASLADALMLALERYGVPWLDARSSHEGAIMVMSDVTTCDRATSDCT